MDGNMSSTGKFSRTSWSMFIATPSSAMAAIQSKPSMATSGAVSAKAMVMSRS